MQAISAHNFHIPVMGLAFSIDTPIKVGPFGINSAISIIEDNLLETMRRYYLKKIEEPYIPIGKHETNYRVRRIKAYLNLMQRLVNSEFEKIKSSTFELGSDLVKYFEMLPANSGLKKKYEYFMSLGDPHEKAVVAKSLKDEMIPGAIEVNIMTKVDKDNLDKEGALIENGSDALTALKAYAESDLKNSSLIFSAGMNPRLYNYLENFTEFDAVDYGQFNKRVVIKVSDYRSALIQGKYLAKKGIWVSEFRIESGLNCGGHVFATPGILMGSILKEFKEKKEELVSSLFDLYASAVAEKGKKVFDEPHPIKITVQGGIGTGAEDKFLHDYYEVDSTGWGTPFLLCPEATTVDEKTLQLLLKSKENDVVRSNASPLGVAFNYLKGTSGEKERLDRMESEKPGSPCTEKYLVSNTEFSDKPICTASKQYQRKKLKQLEESQLSSEEYEKEYQKITGKECLCVGLSNAAPHLYNVPFLPKQQAVTICPGPNIVNFSKLLSLKQMVDHIYGRENHLTQGNRPHMFIKELELYLDFLKEQLIEISEPTSRTIRDWKNYCGNLLTGIAHYKELAMNGLIEKADTFKKAIEKAEENIKLIQVKLEDQPLVAN
ncbi:hypothetical protein C7S20_02375 [Christiangramia fulva]|uniref:Uncharacterized protein n=1 Tax=Christiangramia fulva TaxID=2126553 RepID=A0A2R3Z1Q9_9FLAO|nr:hypothetical protein [Christiangramia fulva]AVR44201.1 hypothetical protein C7S20_02375 [Christiangramia fulva]